MAKIGSTKKILAESFAPEDRAMAQTLGGILNPLLESIVQALNKRLNIADNLDMEIKQFRVDVSAGNITTDIKVRTELQQVTGALVINVTEATATTPSGPVQAQGIVRNGNVVNIQTLTGLETDGKYTVTLLLIGS